jgi:hypothetical protein
MLCIIAAAACGQTGGSGGIAGMLFHQKALVVNCHGPDVTYFSDDGSPAGRDDPALSEERPPDVLRRKLGNGRGRQLIVSFDHADPMPGGDAAHLHLVVHRGADLPTTVLLQPGGNLAAAIDLNVVHVFANTVAKAVISISKMAEGKQE